MASSDDWKRLDQIFHAALEVPAAERAAYLDGACPDSPELRREVEALLAAHETDSQFLEHGLTDLMPAAPGGAPSGPVLSPGQRVGAYLVERELGRGGMGIVYLARDTRLNRPVALKLLPPAVAGDPRRRERLRREARAAAALSHHGIATVYALEEADDHLFIVSEYVRGRTLREELDETGVFSGLALVDLALDIARTLAAAHHQGVVHRDLKPDNVMRVESGGVKILDFGLARMLPTASEDAQQAPRLTMTGMIVGTPAYMAPEQVRGEAVDARTDQFGFGLLVYELATGRHPFSGNDVPGTLARILSETPVPLDAYGPAVSPALSAIVDRCLNKRPEERYPVTDDLVADLLAVRHQLVSKSGTLTRNTGADMSVSRGALRRWWEGHQIITSLFYGLMLWPMWIARHHIGPPVGPTLFVLAAMATACTAGLRLNLAFASRLFPGELGVQRRRVASLVWIGDVVMCVLWLVAAVLLFRTKPATAALFAGAAISAFIGFHFIEPATARAALGSRAE